MSDQGAITDKEKKTRLATSVASENWWTWRSVSKACQRSQFSGDTPDF